jgi:prevent-host-death family protein
MKKVGAFEAKTHLSQLLTEVETTGRSIVIQRRGKDVAVLAPCQQAAARRSAEIGEEVIEELRALREAQLRRGFPPVANVKEFITEGRKR